MWLEKCWQVVAFRNEIAAKLLPRRVSGQALVLFRTPDGVAHAFEDACAHRRLPLSLGKLIGSEVQCGYHGLRYGADGVCTKVPGQDSIPARARVRTYPLVERDGVVWIWMADPALADTATIPDVPWYGDPTWEIVSGYHYIEAAPMLIVDNLLDLSHETFVHSDTIGNAAVADSPVTAEVLDGSVRVHRDMRDIEPPPLYAAQRGEGGRIDRWHTTTYFPPGYLVIESGSKPSRNRESAAGVFERRIINFITPVNATTSHYFWYIARNYALGDEKVATELQRSINFTFDQDKALLEAQQRSLGPDPDQAFPVSIKVDAGPILGRRLLQTLIERERGVGTPELVS